MLQLAIGAPLYNCSLALYYLLVIKYNWSNEMLHRIERWVHVAILSFSIGSSIALLPLEQYNPIGTVCWVIGSPQRCGHSSYRVSDVPCERGDYAYLYGLALFYGPLWVCVLACIVSMVAIYFEVRKTHRRMRRYSMPPDVSEQGYSKKKRRLQVHALRRSATDQTSVAMQAILYSLSFFVTWTPSTIWSIAHWFNVESFALDFLSAFCEPLQGFWNALIFIRKRPGSQEKLRLLVHAIVPCLCKEPGLPRGSQSNNSGHNNNTHHHYPREGAPSTKITSMASSRNGSHLIEPSEAIAIAEGQDADASDSTDVNHHAAEPQEFILDSSDAMTPATEEPSQEARLPVSSAVGANVAEAEDGDARQPWNRRLWRVSFAAAMADKMEDNGGSDGTNQNHTEKDGYLRDVHFKANDSDFSADHDGPQISPSVQCDEGGEADVVLGYLDGANVEVPSLDSLDLAQERMTLAEEAEHGPPSACVVPHGGAGDPSAGLMQGSSRSHPSARSSESVTKGPRPEHRFI
jgi:hypothetical protein